MASITKRPNGIYYCQVRLTGAKSRFMTFQSRLEAEKWAAEQEREIRMLLSFKKPLTTLADETIWDVGRRYCLTVLRGKPSCHETELQLKRISKHFPQRFKNINKFDINNYRIKRLETVNSTTCRDDLVLISRLFRWVSREFLLELPNPCDGVKIPKANKPRDKVVTEEEMKQLLSVMTPIMRMVIELAYETAMRRSELLRLTPECLHLEERLLDVVDGKTGSRTVPLSRRAVEILQTASESCPSEKSRLFEVTGSGVTQALINARRKLGLSEDIRVHQLRHSRISLVARKGFNNAQIMAVSGHRDVRSVQRYTHLNASDVVKLLD